MAFDLASQVYFIRHGQTDWNAENRLQGQADTDLNAFGRAQASANGVKLKGLIGDALGFDFVSSPMKRTRETMERVRENMGLPRDGYRTDPRLVEINFGEWQGYTFEELDLREPGASAVRAKDKWNFVPPGEGAQSYATLTERVRTWFEELDRPTVCVSHGGVMRSIIRLATDMPENDVGALSIPQDRILVFRDRKAVWL
ncbi:histidine phosphatase family protein [Mesorhizobium sp. SB112]|uniref:histidine phosphatase family protein n=1 Tax=Mesorhizobium sp. SB112 TaxID=3151853 RepID=UPI003267856F